MILLELFTSPTCPYCPAAKKVIGSVASQLNDAVVLDRDISLKENQEIASRYGITSVPTLVINEKYIIVSPTDARQILNILQQI